MIYLAPPVGVEPTTQRLTAACSATELQGNLVFIILPVFYENDKEKLDINIRY